MPSVIFHLKMKYHLLQMTRNKKNNNLHRRDCTCIRSWWTNLMNVPVTELSWNLNLPGIFIHSEVNVTAEPFELHTVPLLVI